jgi:uncharacterized integral membrane protein
MRLRDRTDKLGEDYQPRLWLVIGGLVLVVAYILYFVAANDDEVSVQFLVADARTSLIWVILLSLFLGVVIGVLLSQLYRRRRSASSVTPSSTRSGDS